MTQGLPIITTHLGSQPYLSYTMVQARLWNPASDVHLIGDQNPADFRYVIQHDINMYSGRAREFEKHYVHFSKNGEINELLCMQRWLILDEFVKAQGWKRVFIMDSDVLLFADITQEHRKYSKFLFTLCHFMSAGEAYFDAAVLSEFADFLFDLYKDKSGFWWDKLMSHIDITVRHGGSGGLSDMMIFNYFRQRYAGLVGESMEIVEGATFDHHINTGAPGFEMEDGIKKIYFGNDNRPYGKFLRTGEMVRFLSLHFQGGAKWRIPVYFREPPGVSAQIKQNPS